MKELAPVPVPRFETCEGQHAQIDHGAYNIDFTREGRRRVYLFGYLLGYSRRQHLRWVESMDLLTTLRERCASPSPPTSSTKPSSKPRTPAGRI